MPKRKTLRISDDGCCAFHPCDECDRCVAGDCCGNDVGEAGLPLEGSWKYETFGNVGVLNVNAKDGKLQCHCCGEWFESLARHTQAHNLTADSYRAMWGLNCGQALMATELRVFRSQLAKDYGHRLTPEEALKPTPEQRSKWSYAREARAQRRIDKAGRPRNEVGQWTAATPGKWQARQHPFHTPTATVN